MAVAAIDEAMRNIICVGGDPTRTAILDNFCWGNCEDPQTMGTLVRACQGCYDAAVAYGTPFISGKDSLNNEFALDPRDAEQLADRIRLCNNRIRIPETLLISAISIIDDVRRCVTMDLKPAPDSLVYFVGLEAKTWPEVDLLQAASLHHEVAQLIRAGIVLAAHDCGDEGVLPALAEMAFAGECGIEADFSDRNPFAPIPCGYMLQINPADSGRVAKLAKLAKQAKQAKRVTVQQVGRSHTDRQLTWQSSRGERIEVSLRSLSDAWRSPLSW